MTEIRRALVGDFDGIWEIFHAVVGEGDTYAYPPNTTPEEARDFWMGPSMDTFVALEGEKVVGTYILKPNFPGLGSHVANAAFMVHPSQRGRGLGRTLAQHALEEARRQGFLAMQFNQVVATNTGAIALWKDLGFRVIGTVPKAFQHSKLGLVDAMIMYCELGGE